MPQRSVRNLTIPVLLSVCSTALGVETAASRSAADSLVKAFPGAQIHRDGGQVQSVFGTPMTVGATPAAAAQSWISHYAGVFEAGKGFAPTEEGTPQGGIISPLLLNVALHGLEEAAGVRYQDGEATQVTQDSPALVRYADDFAACCHSRQQAGQVKARLAGWLAQRGLSLNEDKTRRSGQPRC